MKSLIVIALLCGLAAAQVFEVFNEEDPKDYADCHELKDAGYSTNGTYLLTFNDTKVPVVCEFEGKWVYLIILRRLDDQLDFGQSFNAYRKGFGHTMGDYWVGLDYIHKLTSGGNMILDIHMLDWANRKTVVTYYHFEVGTYPHYKLHVGGYHGKIKDDLSYNNGMSFYTLDKPDPYNCVHDMRGGWWYRHCSKTLPTGHYYQGGYYHQKYYWADGIFWMDYISAGYSLKRLYLTIRKY